VLKSVELATHAVDLILKNLLRFAEGPNLGITVTEDGLDTRQLVHSGSQGAEFRVEFLELFRRHRCAHLGQKKKKRGAKMSEVCGKMFGHKGAGTD
jgi:hypothetical protein